MNEEGSQQQPSNHPSTQQHLPPTPLDASFSGTSQAGGFATETSLGGSRRSFEWSMVSAQRSRNTPGQRRTSPGNMGKERLVGVCRTAAMSEFDRGAVDSQTSICDDQTGSVLTPTEGRRTCGAPPSEHLAFGESMPSRPTSMFSVDLNSARGKRNTLLPEAQKATYGSLGSTSNSAVVLPVPYQDTLGRYDAFSVSHVRSATRIHHRFGAPWMGVAEAAGYAFMMILGLAVSSTGDMNFLAKGCLCTVLATACFATHIAVNGYILTLSEEDEESFVLDEDVATKLLQEGWSSEAIDSFEADLRTMEAERKQARGATARDIVVAFGHHAAGAFVPCCPVLLSRVIGATEAVVPVAAAGSLAFGLFAAVLLYQISCAPVRYFSSRTALVSFVSLAALCGAIVGVALALNHDLS